MGALDGGTDGLTALVARWAAGFALTRRGSAVRDGATFALRPSDSTRRLEYVVVGDATMTEPLGSLLGSVADEAVGDPGVWLTTVTTTPYDWVPPAGVAPRTRGESFMTTTLGAPGPCGALWAPPDAPPRVRVAADGPVGEAAVTIGGERAAQGLVGMVGTDAIFDRIGTEPAHRRRGLARDVMLALTRWSLDHGARTGLLIASVEGRPLYEGLGWRPIGHVASYAATGGRDRG